MEVEAVMAWLVEVDRFFEIMVIEKDLWVSIVAYKLKEGAATWW